MLWKLRVPASLPFVFSALKISATACVIGAIIGETPASIQDGLGGAIVNFNQYYSTGPERLWATNIVCAVLGLVFFASIVIAEKLVAAPRPGALRMNDRPAVAIKGVSKQFKAGVTALIGIDLDVGRASSSR